MMKILLGIAGAVGLFEGYRWYERHKSQYSLQNGHTYTVVLDASKQPVAPASQTQVQSALDGQFAGVFDVVNVATDAVARRVTILVSVTGPSLLITGDQLTTALALPPGFGKVTLDSLTEAASTAVVPAAGGAS